MSREYTCEDAHRDLQAQAKTLSAYADEIQKHDTRLAALETANRLREISEAREEERDKALNARLEKIEKAIEGIQGVGNKLVWLVGSGIVLAFLTFMFKGGLTI